MFRVITTAHGSIAASSLQSEYPSEIVMPKIYSSQFRSGVQMLDLVVEMAG